MKITLTTLLILIGFSSYSQNNFFNATCECIKEITEKSNQRVIAEQIQNCFQMSFQNHNSEIRPILQNYVAEKPEMDMKAAEKNQSKILTEKLSEECPKFKEIDQKLTGQKENSGNVLNAIADEICIELEDKTNLTDKVVDPILIDVTKRHQVSVYGQYNLNERTEMKRFATDLNTVLMKGCPGYKMFVDKKNSEK